MDFSLQVIRPRKYSFASISL